MEALFQSIQNAFIYGYRVRFLHSTAYQIASGKGLQGLIKSIKLALQHGKILSLFAIFYNIGCYYNHFIGGLLAGMVVHGGMLGDFVDVGICEQITMYAMSRMIIAVSREIGNTTSLVGGSDPARRKKINDITWMLGSGIIWALIMMYYGRDKKSGKKYLPKAMYSSLEFMYGLKKHNWNEILKYGK